MTGTNFGRTNFSYRNDSQTTKMLFLVIIVVVIIMGALLIWQFGPSTDSSTATISNITIDLVSSSGARISWYTDVPASSQVMYGKSSSYGMLSPFYAVNDPTVDEKAGVKVHSVILSGLTQDTVYHFKVKSKTGNGNESISSTDMTFKTSERLNFAGVE